MNNQIKAYWSSAKQFYYSYSTREQLLAVAALFLLTTGVFYFIFYKPVTHWQQRVAKQNATVKTELSMIKADLVVEQAKANRDPDKVIKKKREQLQKAMLDLESQLGVYDSQLISMSRLMAVMQQLLHKESGVDLVAIEANPDEQESGGDDSVHLYRQGVKMVFKADFFTTLDYLTKLEQLKWRLFWDKLNYKVIGYPRATVTLEIHTLSETKA